MKQEIGFLNRVKIGKKKSELNTSTQRKNKQTTGSTSNILALSHTYSTIFTTRVSDISDDLKQFGLSLRKCLVGIVDYSRRMVRIHTSHIGDKRWVHLDCY